MLDDEDRSPIRCVRIRKRRQAPQEQENVNAWKREQHKNRTCDDQTLRSRAGHFRRVTCLSAAGPVRSPWRHPFSPVGPSEWRETSNHRFGRLLPMGGEIPTVPILPGSQTLVNKPATRAASGLHSFSSRGRASLSGRGQLRRTEVLGTRRTKQSAKEAATEWRDHYPASKNRNQERSQYSGRGRSSLCFAGSPDVEWRIRWYEKASRKGRRYRVVRRHRHRRGDRGNHRTENSAVAGLRHRAEAE